MTTRARPLAFAVVLTLTSSPLPLHAQTPPERAVRRDIPITGMFRRGLEAGTRDSTGHPGPSYWQTRVDYDIDARLDPATAVVSGRETATIHNRSPEPMQAVVLRLDQNIFAANVPRLSRVPEITGGLTLTRLAVDGREASLSEGGMPRRPGAPEEGPRAYGVGQTVAFVLLQQPIAPGSTATLEAEWSFRVPLAADGRGLRMGRWADSLYQVAQWYPRVAVYDDVRGWDTEPYLGSSEFYNNFGSFDVRLDVPAGWIVGATGVLQNPDEVLTAEARQRLAGVLDSDATVTIVGAGERGPGRATAEGERLVWRFVADTVNDFAWAASDRYLWSATRATISGRGPVPVHLLYTAPRADPFARAAERVRHALEFYSSLWIPYAFPQHTIVDGPESGMEYPMFIMSGLGAADHEVGHQWWPMMVGVNETWYGFMDEGFNQYMNILSSADLRGTEPVLDSLGQRYGTVSGNEAEAPLMWNANYGGPMYGFQAYQKAPLMLSMLGGVVGDSAVWRAMSDYARVWEFKHPTPWDFAFFMNDALDRDLGWFWHAWLFTTDAVDGSLDEVVPTAAGAAVVVRQDGAMPSPVVLRVELAADGPAIRPMPNSRMLDAHTALVTWPVDVWFGGSRTFRAELDFGGRTIERVTLDPGGRFPDRDPSDNVWARGG